MHVPAVHVAARAEGPHPPRRVPRRKCLDQYGACRGEGRDAFVMRPAHKVVPRASRAAPSLPPQMLTTLLVSTLVFTLLYLGFVTTRYGLALADEARQEERNAS